MPKSKKQSERDTQFIKDHYNVFSVALPTGYVDKINNYIELYNQDHEKKLTRNAFIRILIDEKLEISDIKEQEVKQEEIQKEGNKFKKVNFDW